MEQKNWKDMREPSDLSDGEKCLEEALRKAGKALQVPDKLSPGDMKYRLEEHMRRKKRRKKQFTGFLSAAAVLVLFVGVICYQSGMGRIRKTSIPERKITVAGDGEENREKNSEEEESFTYAKDYDEIYEALQAIDKRKSKEAKAEWKQYENTATEISLDKSSADSGKQAYSRTNTQVKDVDEGDLAKTDGNYIYHIAESDGAVSVVKADNGKMETVSLIKGFSSPMELYIRDNTLIVLDEEFFITGEEDVASQKKSQGAGNTVKIYFYDITDKKNPKEIRTLTQSGMLSASRIYGDYLYFVTAQQADVNGGKDARKRYVPTVNGECIPAGDVYIPEKCNYTAYQTISSVQISNPSDAVDTKAVASSGDIFYMSTESLYIADAIWVDASRKKASYTDKTEILKFGIRDGKITSKGKVRIKGHIEDSFSMDEYKGNLRVVTSVTHYKIEDDTIGAVEEADGVQSNKTDNSLYVLDDGMALTGSIEGLARDERIYSARFMGDTGYFVTYRETDPLFSVNLSDPQKPEIIGELKIPGFSEYLHFYDENLLLGIGEERTGTERETGEEGTGTERVGLKLSMFDISDPANVVEKDKMLLKEYEYADALYNHKAVLIDTDKNLFGFLAEYVYDTAFLTADDTRDSEETMVEGEEQETPPYGHYVLFSYDKKKGFVRNMTIPVDAEKGITTRGLYIGDVLYLCSSWDQSMDSYRMSTREKVGSLNESGKKK